MDGTEIIPSQFIEVTDKKTEPNPAYSTWKKVDTTILSWINATLIEVCRFHAKETSYGKKIEREFGCCANGVTENNIVKVEVRCSAGMPHAGK